MIYIIRHGQTDWNLEGRYAGRIDIPLNDLGRKQAEDVKEKLKNIKFDKVFSSPLVRAFETAQIVCDNEIIIDNRLIERSNGDLEGVLKTEITDYIDFNDPNEASYNIESIVEFRKRINDFFDEITNLYKEENILVVTHAGVGIYARCYFEGEPKDNNYNNYKIRNCEAIIYNNLKEW